MKHCCRLYVLKVICVTVMASEVGYTSSAISYSHGVPRHTDLKEAKYVRQLPMNSIINAQQSCLYYSLLMMVVKVKVLKANGA